MFEVSLEVHAKLEPLSDDPSAFITHYTAVVLADDASDDGVPLNIGTASAYVLDLEAALETENSLFDVLDDEPGLNVYVALLADDEEEYSVTVARTLGLENEENWVRKVLILDTLEIRPEFRGRGYGLQAIKVMLRHLGSGCSIAAMRPFPLQFQKNNGPRDQQAFVAFKDNLASSRSRLRDYYSQLGFAHVRGTELMVLRMGNPAPEMWSTVVME